MKLYQFLWYMARHLYGPCVIQWPLKHLTFELYVSGSTDASFAGKSGTKAYATKKRYKRAVFNANASATGICRIVLANSASSLADGTYRANAHMNKIRI
jgi:hypothetical protein